MERANLQLPTFNNVAFFHMEWKKSHEFIQEFFQELIH